MQKDTFNELLEKYIDDSIQPGERHQFSMLLEDAEYLRSLNSTIDSELAGRIYEGEPDERIRQLIHQYLNKSIQPELPSLTSDPQPVVSAGHRVHFLKTAWFRYAAVFLLFAGTGIVLYKNDKFSRETARQQPTQWHDAGPGGNKATLTLADGRTIILDTSGNVTLSQQGGITVIKLNDGQLAYHSGSSPSSNPEDSPQGDRNNRRAGLGEPSWLSQVAYNTVTTPKGSQYQVILADGTRVWLNAASSVQFPTAFGKERIVQITGEVYLEVATDKARPFIVKAGVTSIQVLGTSFNVHAYADEPAVKTSLLEGMVRIDNVVLHPGEAFMNGKRIKTNLNDDLDWKNGLFHFDNAPLPVVLRQLSRWYDFEVIYKNKMPSIPFSGEMLRSLNLGQVIRVLNDMDVKCRLINGKTLVVE